MCDGYKVEGEIGVGRRCYNGRIYGVEKEVTNRWILWKGYHWEIFSQMD